MYGSGREGWRVKRVGYLSHVYATNAGGGVDNEGPSRLSCRCSCPLSACTLLSRWILSHIYDEAILILEGGEKEGGGKEKASIV